MAAIWDAFFFNDEFELLAFRLRELDEHVDNFVIVEGTRTYSGVAKPLRFDRRREDFASWHGRIHHVVAELDAGAPSAWDREKQQRRALRDTVVELADADDLLLVGDVDEVPRRELLPWLRSELPDAVRLEQRHAHGYANTFLAKRWDNGTMAFRLEHVDAHPRLKTQLGHHDPDHDWSSYRELLVPDGGWHLSSLGGADAVRAKVAAYSHQEHNREDVVALDHLQRVVDLGIRMDGREVLTHVPVAQLEPALQRLAAASPHLVTPDVGSATSRRAYAAWTWLRVNARLPGAVRRALDARPEWVLHGPATPPLLLVQGTLATVRRVRRDPNAWKTVERLDAPVPTA